ncbi:MAG: rhodanese-like domain-containing protein [Candidatus Marinimicrobia bacterium]|jgi:rhodanese-related sulfurtransferase|nr:rhodanese-like domain-containing protein [Candidatus Neomarinimicrobiota bacterium]MBT3575191.1 rhodanese-like domain-containing protein [Candidatus Neomarinimicrobiota bacterium]MBT3680877.1 rhodanese-like domain-containing protein [Candidatus Neomarinimicrobiota bacterium]MBT3951415.1 rhodanese-like domain-containing protein [Candidatus Neomarinimicrobiota bacterium]MBT4252847.1 rhodanese-like domain-containing protein [Candidatus Neomarinimicrobiota bacterium]
MIYRLIAYSLILLGTGGTIYIGVEGIYGDHYDIPALSYESFSRQYSDSSNYILIDVRTESEVVSQPAPWSNTIRIPLLSLEDRSMELNQYKDQPMMVLCPTGNRSRQGARILRLAGFDASYMEKGMFNNERIQ